MPKKSNDEKVCEHYTWILFQRHKTWYADGRGNTPSLGKHSLGTTDRTEAIEQLRELDRRMAFKHAKINELPQEDGQEVLLVVGWDAFGKHVARPDVLGGAGPKTQARYRAVRQKHELYCAANGISSWNAITKKEVLAYGSHLAALKYSPATVYLELTVIKQIIKWLIEEEHQLPPSHRIHLPMRRSNESSTFCPTSHQVKAIVERCRADPKLKWMANVITALCVTGLRIGEQSALRWSDIDLPNSMITVPDNRHSGRHQTAGAVRTTKGRRGRRIPIHAELLVVLNSLTRHTDGRVFHGPLGGRLKPDTVLTVLKRDVVAPLQATFPTPKDQIGFTHCRIHSFRHYFVSQAFFGGASEGEIREWVGHTDSRIVERYRHLSNDDAKRKMDRLTFIGANGGNVPTKKVDDVDTDVKTKSANNEGDGAIAKDNILESIDTHESAAAIIDKADPKSVVDPGQRALTVPQVGTGFKYNKPELIEVIQTAPNPLRMFRSGSGALSKRGECDETTTGDPSCVIRQRS